MPQRTKDPPYGERPVAKRLRSHRRVDLALLAGLHVPGGNAGTPGWACASTALLQIAGALDFDPRPCNQQDGNVDGQHGDDRGDRMFAPGIRSAALGLNAGLSIGIKAPGNPMFRNELVAGDCQCSQPGSNRSTGRSARARRCLRQRYP